MGEAQAVEFIANQAEQRRHGTDFLQRDMRALFRHEADDGGTDFFIDEVPAFQPTGADDGFEGLRAIEQIEGHAVFHQGGQQFFPLLQMGEEILAQGDDEAGGRGGIVVIPGEAAVFLEAGAQGGGGAVLDQLGELGEEGAGFLHAFGALAEGEDFLELIEDEDGRVGIEVARAAFPVVQPFPEGGGVAGAEEAGFFEFGEDLVEQRRVGLVVAQADLDGAVVLDAELGQQAGTEQGGFSEAGLAVEDGERVVPDADEDFRDLGIAAEEEALGFLGEGGEAEPRVVGIDGDERRGGGRMDGRVHGLAAGTTGDAVGFDELADVADEVGCGLAVGELVVVDFREAVWLSSGFPAGGSLRENGDGDVVDEALDMAPGGPITFLVDVADAFGIRLGLGGNERNEKAGMDADGGFESGGVVFPGLETTLVQPDGDAGRVKRPAKGEGGRAIIAGVADEDGVLGHFSREAEEEVFVAGGVAVKFAPAAVEFVNEERGIAIDDAGGLDELVEEEDERGLQIRATVGEVFAGGGGPAIRKARLAGDAEKEADDPIGGRRTEQEELAVFQEAEKAFEGVLMLNELADELHVVLFPDGKVLTRVIVSQNVIEQRITDAFRDINGLAGMVGEGVHARIEVGADGFQRMGELMIEDAGDDEMEVRNAGEIQQGGVWRAVEMIEDFPQLVIDVRTGSAGQQVVTGNGVHCRETLRVR